MIAVDSKKIIGYISFSYWIVEDSREVIDSDFKFMKVYACPPPYGTTINMSIKKYTTKPILL